MKDCGVSGLKFFKSFGLIYRNGCGEFFKIDDLCWDLIWKMCGELGLFVFIYIVDLIVFFFLID